MLRRLLLCRRSLLGCCRGFRVLQAGRNSRPWRPINQVSSQCPSMHHRCCRRGAFIDMCKEGMTANCAMPCGVLLLRCNAVAVPCQQAGPEDQPNGMANTCACMPCCLQQTSTHLRTLRGLPRLRCGGSTSASLSVGAAASMPANCFAALLGSSAMLQPLQPSCSSSALAIRWVAAVSGLLPGQEAMVHQW